MINSVLSAAYRSRRARWIAARTPVEPNSLLVSYTSVASTRGRDRSGTRATYITSLRQIPLGTCIEVLTDRRFRRAERDGPREETGRDSVTGPDLIPRRARSTRAPGHLRWLAR